MATRYVIPSAICAGSEKASTRLTTDSPPITQKTTVRIVMANVGAIVEMIRS